MIIGPISLVLVALSFALTVISLQRSFGKSPKSLLCGQKSQKTAKRLSVPTVGLFGFLWMIIRGGFSCQGGFSELGKLGPLVIFSNKLLRIKILFINDLALAKDLFQNPTFNGRLTSELWTYHAEGNNGLLSANGAHYDEQRKFIRRRLKEAGFGTKTVESFISTEIEELQEFFRQNAGKVISPNKLFYKPILNTLWMMIAGQRYTSDENEMSRLALRLFDCMAQSYAGLDAVLMSMAEPMISVNTLESLSNSRWIPSFILPGLRKMKHSLGDLKVFFNKMIAEKRSNLKMTDEPSDFVSAYLQAIESTTNPESTFYKEKGKTNLLAALVDFYMAGGDTTSTMLMWCTLLLVKNPDVQKKIQQEIENVVGNSRPVSISDRPKCPYTEAFIHEVLRTNSVTNGSVPHCTTDDVFVGPYFIEKGTMTLLNISTIHHNPKYWDNDPQNFRPERFLSPDGTTFVKNDAMVAFSIGRRRCTGEQLAKDNLFLVVSSICQKFDLKEDPNSTPSLHPVYSAVHSPRKFYMLVENRKFIDEL